MIDTLRRVIRRSRLVLLFLLYNLVLSSGISAQAQEFRLGPGDVIKVTVFEQPELTTTARVSVGGKIALPLLGSVSVSGLTIAEAEQKFARLLREGGFVKRPQVVVFLEEVRSQQVAVLGQVSKPGKYAIEGRTSVIDLLAIAGGLRDDAGETVTIIREQNGTRKVIEVDIGRFFSGLTDQDINVVAGDRLLIPRMNVFYIYGEVRRPGVYRLESNMTVVQALSVGGGLTDRGTQKGVRVKRRNNKGIVKEVDVDLNDGLLPQDVIYVKERLF